MRTIKFRAKNKFGQWIYGTDNQFESNRTSHYVPLWLFWQEYQNGELDEKTIGQFVEFTNCDGTKGSGYEGDIISHGGDNHNGVIVFADGEFKVEEPRLFNEYNKRIHSLPPTTATVKIIGNIWDNPKLKYRWGKS